VARPNPSHDSPADRAGALSWTVFLLLLALLFLPGLEQPGDAPRRALLLAGAPVLMLLAARSVGFAPAGAVALAVGLAAVAGGAGAVLAPAPERGSVLRDLLLLAAPWMLAFAASSPSAGPGVERGLRRAAGIALPLLGVAGLAQAWLGWEGIAQARAPAATFVSRVPLAEFLVVAVPFGAAGLAAAAARPGGRRAAWIAALGTGLGVALLAATRNRGGLVAAAIGGSVGLALALGPAIVRRERTETAGRRLLGPVLLAAALALAGFLLPTGGREPLPSVASRFAAIGAGDRTVDIRLALARNALEIVRGAPWLGVGAGRFPVVYPLHHARVAETPGFGLLRQAEHAENDPIELASELGVPATAALLLLLAGAIVRSAREALYGEEDGRIAAAARVAALVGVLVHGLVSFPLRSPATSGWAWTIAGLAWAASRPAWPARARTGVVALGALLALVGTWLAIGELRAQSALGAAIRAQSAGECAPALARAAEVPRDAPWLRRERGIAAMVIYACEPDGPRSLAALEPALARHPNQLNLLLGTGARRLKAGRYAEAEALYAHALSIDPGLGRAWLGLAMARDGAGNASGAREACASGRRFLSEVPEIRTFCEGNGYDSY